MYTCVTFGKMPKTTEFNYYCIVSGYYVDGSGCRMSSKIEIHINYYMFITECFSLPSFQQITNYLE